MAKTFRGFSPRVYKLLVKLFYFAMHGCSNVVKIKTFIISGFPYQTEYIYFIKMHLRSIIFLFFLFKKYIYNQWKYIDMLNNNISIKSFFVVFFNKKILIKTNYFLCKQNVFFYSTENIFIIWFYHSVTESSLSFVFNASWNVCGATCKLQRNPDFKQISLIKFRSSAKSIHEIATTPK